MQCLSGIVWKQVNSLLLLVGCVALWVELHIH